MDHRKLSEMIDACRRGSADLELPELSPLAEQIAADPGVRARYERTQQLDLRVAEAFADIEVPDGLHERILARVRQQETAEQGQNEIVADDVDSTGNAAAGRTGRRWAISLAAAAAALLVMAGIYALWPRHDSLTYDNLLNLSSEWYAELSTKVVWQPLPPNEMIRDFPVPAAIRPHPANWADVSTVVGESACAYDLTAADGRRAALFVIVHPGQIAGSNPPLMPGSSTGGLMIGCWQSGNLVYILIVEGSENSYRRLLDAAGPPLARSGKADGPLQIKRAIKNA